MLGIVLLAGLIGLTSWVVASLSTWLVPVYVTALVLIFATPRANHRGDAEASGRGGIPADADANGSAAATADGVGAAGPAEGGSSPSSDGAAAASASAVASTSRPRRSRGRARKPAKPGPEPAAAASPASWIRVGPGKFVRADAPFPAPDGPEAGPEPAAASEPPGADGDSLADPPGMDRGQDPGSEPVEPGSTALPEAAEVEQAPPVDPALPDVGAEGYGNAPSAFGPGPEIVPGPEDAPEQAESGPAEAPGSDHAAAAAARGGSAPEGCARERTQGGGDLRQTRLTPDLVAVLADPETPRLRALPSARLHPNGRRARSRLAAVLVSGPRTRGRTRRRDGRRGHPHRTFQPRSPPGRA